MTNGAGTRSQSFGVPTSAAGGGLKGAIFDSANTCASLGLMTTASFASQF